MGRFRYVQFAGVMALVTSVSAAAATSCATCTREVALSKAEVQCVLERVTRQLSSSLDPVVVATNSCGAKIRDGTRLEAVRQGRPPSRKSGRRPNEPYLLTKADAQCLVRKIRQADPKARELHFDLRTCE